MLYQQNQPWRGSRKGGEHHWPHHYFLLLMRQPTSMKAFAKQPDQSSSSAKKVWVQTAGRLCLQSCCSMTSSCSHPIISHSRKLKAGEKHAGTKSQFTSCFKECSKIWLVLVFTTFLVSVRCWKSCDTDQLSNI